MGGINPTGSDHSGRLVERALHSLGFGARAGAFGGDLCLSTVPLGW